MIRSLWYRLWQLAWHIGLPALFATLVLWPAQSALIVEGRDIRQDYLGALRFFRGEDPYAPFTEAELRSIGVDSHLGMPRNFHPPTSLVVFAPFALLEFSQSVRIWSLISLIAFYASISIIRQQLNIRVCPLLLVLAAFWYPLWLHIRFGQFSSLVLLLLTLFWRSEREGHSMVAGAYLGVAILVKLFPAVLVLLLVLKGRWTTVASAILIAGTGTAVVFLYHPE